MTTVWALGTNKSVEIFVNDDVANSLRDAVAVQKARNAFYAKYKGFGDDLRMGSLTNYQGDFGLRGLWNAGIDPIEQFVGSMTINIHQRGVDLLQYTIWNRTSMRSFLYGIYPSVPVYGIPGGYYEQIYIFFEPINFNKLR